MKGIRARSLGAVAAAIWILFTPVANAQVSVTTYHNDNSRTGQNAQETTLTPANVNIASFGKLFSVAVDGAVYAQPLYVSNVGIGGGTHNVVYAATEHDSVYAIDADTGTIYWQKSLIPAGGSTVSSSTDLNCGDITTEVGITGTPVIDPSTGTLYVVAKVKLNGAISQYLHALAITTGAEKFGGPNSITASVPGDASDGDGTMVTFNPRQENQRSALLLENGHVIVAWTSHCDRSPWHGWVMSFGASTLTLEGTYNASANGYGNGIWMSGGGPAADTAGNIYFATGNGSWNTTDRGDSVVRLGPPTAATLPVLDYFTTYNQISLTNVDYDLSSGGLVLLPTLANGRELTVIMGKQGNIFLLDRNNLGKYCIKATPACTNSNPQIVQEVDGVFTGYWSTPAYWNGNLYFGGGNDYTGADEPIKAYSFNANGSGLLSTTPTSVTAKDFGFSGPVPSISSNGNSNAILWAIDDSRVRSTCAAGATCQWLYAYDATNLGNLLYSSALVPNGRDSLGQPVKFVTPTIANGKVYVPSGGAVSAFGLLDHPAPTATAPTLTPGGGSYSTAQTVTMADTTPNAAIYYTLDGSTPTPASTKYAGAVAITASTTVKALAVASGYTASAVTTAVYTLSATPPPPPPPPATGSTPVSLTSADNVYGISNNGVATTHGGFDGNGYALSSALLGSAVTWSGLTFDLGVAGAASAVSSATITLPAGQYASLNLLAAAVNGSQPAQQFIVKYTDGSTTTFTQGISDWWTPQNYAGESKALKMSYVLNATGAERAATYYLYGYTFALNPAKTVASLTLPANRHVVLVATTLSGAAATTPAKVSVSLTGVANVYALANNGVAVTNGGFDTHDYAVSKTLLGASQTWSGSTFTLGAAGAADAASSVTVPLPAGAFTTLQLLAAGCNGSQAAQQFAVTYTDGTTTTFTQGISDWWTPKNYVGESRAVTMSYVLEYNGAERQATYYLYGYSFTLNPAKTVKSLTLPKNRNVVLFAAELTGQ
jgi:hypothetical protein